MWGHSEKVAVCKPGGEGFGETKPAHTVILRLPASRTVQKLISVD